MVNTASGGKILAGWAFSPFSIPTFRAHQSDYQEIEAEGATSADACIRLIELLEEAIDFASEAWRRRPPGLALVDARAFDRSSGAIGQYVQRVSGAASK